MAEDTNPGAIVPAPPPLTTSQPSEPLVSAGAVGTLVTTTVGLVVVLVPMSGTLQAALLAFLLAAAPIVLAVIARRKVWSPESVRQLVLAERGQRRTTGRHFKTGGPV